MSPTRRDVLKSLAVATVAVALPQSATAAPESFDSDTTIDDAIYDHMSSFEALSDRLVAESLELQDRLVKHAIETGVWLEEESPRSFVARRADRPGECEIVTARACTCRRYRVWHRCEHVALVRRILDERGQS